MKKILITGANSYIGTSFENYVNQWPNEFDVETVDMIDGNWRNKNFAEYDVVFHVAGIAHVSTDRKMEDIYYKVNRDLTIEAAKKALTDGVKQFVFMSSIIVYGDSSRIRETKIINKNTIPNPANFYGRSKLEAELGILPLQSDNFNVAVIRPPMIYGKGSKGNYPKLSKLAQKVPIFPHIQNERSILHIDNLCEFIKLIILNNESGIFFPQNSDYISISEMVKSIAGVYCKKILLVKLFNPFIILIEKFVPQIDKVFGSLVYDKGMSEYKQDYRVRNLKESFWRSENN